MTTLGTLLYTINCPMTLDGTRAKILELLRSAISSGESLSMREIADKIGVESPNTVMYHFRKLEDAGLIVRDSGGKIIRVNEPGKTFAVAYLPLLGSAPCGEPFIAEENYERLIPVPLRLVGRDLKRPLYLVRAVGNSMYPKIQDRDYVVFEPNPAPTFGSIVVARTEEGVTIKRLEETKQEYVLRPENEDYQQLVFPKEKKGKTFEIDGVAVTVIKPEENLRNGDDIR